MTDIEIRTVLAALVGGLATINYGPALLSCSPSVVAISLRR